MLRDRVAHVRVPGYVPAVVGALVLAGGVALTGLLDRVADQETVVLGALVAMAVVSAALAATVARRRVRLEEAVALAEDELRAKEETSRATLDALEEGVVLSDTDGRALLVNAAARAILGDDPFLEALLGAERWVVGPGAPVDLPGQEQPIRHTIGTGTPVRGAVIRWPRPDGSTVTVRVSTQPVLGDHGAVARVATTFADITAELATQEALRSSEARLEALVEHSSDVIVVLDREGTLRYVSPPGTELFGQDDLVGRSMVDVLHPSDVVPARRNLQRLLTSARSVRRVEARVTDGRGGWRPVEIVATNRVDEPGVGGVVCNLRDVTERAEAAARLTWQAYHDPLTTLPNRARLVASLAQSLQRASARGTLTAVFYLDIDRFKSVNDSLGHEAGDQLLVQVAERLREAVRGRDLVARLGGDEFVVVAESLLDREEALAVARRILAAVARPIHVGDATLRVTTSIGIAFDTDGQAETLLRDADTALYKAKERGRDRWAIFDDDLRSERIGKVAAEQTIRRALDEDGLVVQYQPVVDLVTGAVISAEALLRLAGPYGELLPPGAFVAVAEETGLIGPIGAGVLDDACRQLATWRRTLGERAPRSISVNVAARQVAHGGFASLVGRTIERHGLHPSMLTLELTESTLIDADRSTTDAVQALHEHGVRLAIDDFGTGYSSLSYLKRFPVDIVKVDRSFIDGLGELSSDTEIVRAVLALSEALGLITVAEGVETPQQLEVLRSLGCDAAQGYLFSPAVAADDLAAVVDGLQRPTSVG